MNFQVILDSAGRPRAASRDSGLGPDAVLITFPEDFDFEHMHDYIFMDGKWIYDPLPEPEPEPDPMTDMLAMALDHEYRLTLMELGV